MTSRIVRVKFHAHGPRRFAAIDTTQLSIPELARLIERARDIDASAYGNMTVEVINDPKTPDIQRFMITSNKRGLSRGMFEEATKTIMGTPIHNEGWEDNPLDLEEWAFLTVIKMLATS